MKNKLGATTQQLTSSATCCFVSIQTPPGVSGWNNSNRVAVVEQCQQLVFGLSWEKKKNKSGAKKHQLTTSATCCSAFIEAPPEVSGRKNCNSEKEECFKRKR